MSQDQENAAASTDPTVANELRELDALTNESPTPGAAEEAASAAAAADRRAERVQHYTGKVRPFIESWGARLQKPLDKMEVEKLSTALADVGAEIIPEHEIDTTPHPWRNLLIVSIGIAAPRIVAGIIARRQAAAGHQVDGQGAPPAPASSPAASTEKPVRALDIAKGWD